MRIMAETVRDPFTGIGKPEPLKGEEGVWSRRITAEHRLTYRVTPSDVHFIQARFIIRGKACPAGERPNPAEVCLFTARNGRAGDDILHPETVHVYAVATRGNSFGFFLPPICYKPVLHMAQSGASRSETAEEIRDF